MARYSRRRGPVANFALTTTDQLIPGLTVTRAFDNGELLILAHARFDTDSGVTNPNRLSIYINGVQETHPFIEHHVQALQRAMLSLHHIVPTSRGTHTIDLRASSRTPAGDVLIRNTAELVVIQLPRWDQEDDLL